MIMAKRDFYEVLFHGTSNKVIPEILRTMNARITRLRAVGLASVERREASRNEIRQLVDVLKSRDGAAAAEISRHHVVEAARAALQSLPN